MLDRRPTLSDRDRLRLFRLYDGTCHLCRARIGIGQAWEIEHVISRGMIGKDADTDENMQPAHVRCHKPKTAQDANDLARAKRREAKHHGAHRPRSTMPCGRDSAWKRTIGGRVVPRYQPALEEV